MFISEEEKKLRPITKKVFDERFSELIQSRIRIKAPKSETFLLELNSEMKLLRDIRRRWTHK